MGEKPREGIYPRADLRYGTEVGAHGELRDAQNACTVGGVGWGGVGWGGVGGGRLSCAFAFRRSKFEFGLESTRQLNQTGATTGLHPKRVRVCVRGAGVVCVRGARVVSLCVWV